MRRTIPFFLIGLQFVASTTAGPIAGEPETWAFTVAQPTKELRLNAKASGRPAIVWEDVSRHGVPIDRVEVAGIKLGTRILSGSRFALHHDRLGTWDYDFGMRAFPKVLARADKAKRAELADKEYPYCKRLHDPVPPFRSARPYPAQLMMMLRSRGVREVSYPLDFGPDFEAIGLVLYPWRWYDDGTGGAGSGVWLKGDREGRFSLEAIASTGDSVVARKRFGEAEVRYSGRRGQCYLPLPGITKFRVTFGMVEGDMVLFAGGGLTVYLRYKGEMWPVLSQGENRVQYVESSQSSGDRAVQLLLNESIVFPGFERGCAQLQIQGNGVIERAGTEQPDDAFINRGGFVRLLPKPGESRWTTTWGVPSQHRDLRHVRAVRVTYRIPTWCGRVQIDARAGAEYLPLGAPALIPATPKPALQWQSHVKLLPSNWAERRDVRSLIIRAWGPAWTPDPDKVKGRPCVEIGCIEFLPFGAGERERADEEHRRRTAWKEALVNSPIRRRLDALPLPIGPHVNPRDVLARGVWGLPVMGQGLDMAKLGCSDQWDYLVKLLNDLEAHNLNAIHFEIAAVPKDLRDPFIKLVHERGMRLWGCYSFLAHMIRSSPNAPDSERQKQWQRYMGQWETFLTKYRTVPTFLAFEVGEEPYRWTLPYILQARQIMARLGSQPQLMLYNNTSVLLDDCATEPLPAGACMDSYVFLTLHTRKERYLAFLAATWEGAKRCGGVAWFTPQLVGGRHVYLAPSRAEMRFQVWTAVAYNVKGFFPWAYGFAKAPDFSDKNYYQYYANEMGRLAAMEKLLIAMERSDDLVLLEDVGDDILVGCFEDRQNRSFRFAVVVNTNTEVRQTPRLRPRSSDDVVVAVRVVEGDPQTTRVMSGEALTIEPGDGVVMFVGSREKVSLVQKRYWP